MEIWKPIPKFSDYEVSNLGRVKSIRPRRGSRAAVNNGIIDGWVKANRYGYKRQAVSLRKDGATVIRHVHLLVLEAFVGEALEGQVCRHLDGNALNNKLSNLKWGTRKENTEDAMRHGTFSPPPVHKGESHPQAKISDEIVNSIRGRKLQRGEAAALARELGVSQNTISRWVKGKSRGS